MGTVAQLRRSAFVERCGALGHTTARQLRNRHHRAPSTADAILRAEGWPRQAPVTGTMTFASHNPADRYSASVSGSGITVITPVNGTRPLSRPGESTWATCSADMSPADTTSSAIEAFVVRAVWASEADAE